MTEEINDLNQENTDLFPISQIDIRDGLSRGFADFARYTIQERGLPDLRDGLLPVQRRILYAMYKARNTYDRPKVKSARVVGEVMGKYHPHGDSSIYSALARLSKDWLLLYPLIDFQGNNGSIDGDNEAASRYCVVGDTIVNMADGSFRRIEDIVPNSELDSTTEIDEWVQDMNGNRVHASKFFNSGKHPIIKITLATGVELEGTHNHPVLVLRDGQPPRKEWVTLDKIQKGDVVLQHINTKLDDKILKHDSLAVFLGGMVAEGYNSIGRMGFNNTDKEYYDLVTQYLTEQQIPYYSYQRKLPSGKTIYEMDIQNTENVERLTTLIDECQYHKSGDKCIPKIVWNSNRSFQRSFLAALFEGDGSLRGQKRRPNNKTLINISYCSKSLRLIKEIQILLLNFGISSQVKQDKRKESSWLLTVTGQRNIDYFYTNIGFLTTKQDKFEILVNEVYKTRTRSVSKKEKIPYVAEYIRSELKQQKSVRPDIKEYIRVNSFDTLYNKNKNQDVVEMIRQYFDDIYDLFEQDYIYTEVTDIEHLSEDVVYSIKVDTDDHSFLTNGIVSHNTEARLSKIAHYLLDNIEKNDLVDWRKNFDDSLDEPVYLPAQYPNILVQGISSISTGYASSIPPHNLKEVIESAIAILNDPDTSFSDLPFNGPDLPTGGVLTNGKELERIYSVGQGSFRVRGKYHVEQAGKRSKTKQIVFTEIPYGARKPAIIERVMTLLEEKQLNGVHRIEDESGREGIRVTLTVDADVDVEVITEILYQKTPLQQNTNLNLTLIDKGHPKRMGLIPVLKQFNAFRIETIVRELTADNEQDLSRMHVLKGLFILANHTDEIVRIVKQSNGKAQARELIMAKYEIDTIQANAILELQVHRMNQVSLGDYQAEFDAAEERVDARKQILDSEELLNALLEKQYEMILENYDGDLTRKTEVVQDVEAVDITLDSLVQKEHVFVGVNEHGFVKKSTPRSYNSTDKSEMDDYVLETDTHQHVLMWTNKGNYVYYSVHDIEETRWGDEGVHLSRMGIALEHGEKIIALSEYTSDANYFILRNTMRGKVGLAETLAMTRTNEMYSCGGVDDNEEVIAAGFIQPTEQVAIETIRHYKTKRPSLTEYMVFSIEDVDPIGRLGKGRMISRIGKTRDFVGVYIIEPIEETQEIGSAPKEYESDKIVPRSPEECYHQYPQLFIHEMAENCQEDSEDELMDEEEQEIDLETEQE